MISVWSLVTRAGPVSRSSLVNFLALSASCIFQFWSHLIWIPHALQLCTTDSGLLYNTVTIGETCRCEVAVRSSWDYSRADVYTSANAIHSYRRDWQQRPYVHTVRDNYNLKSHKYVCITTYQSDTKSNPNPNPTTKQHAIVNIHLNIVTCSTYPEKFIRDMFLYRLCDFRL